MTAVGRFYYRRPNAESSADVFDRVSAFWDSLLGDSPTSLLLGRKHTYDTALLVTHGLTIRLLLMAVFQWSVWTFESVFNLGNCQHITLVKNMDRLCYELAPKMSNPTRVPWATRAVWLRLKSKQPSAETLDKLRALGEWRDGAVGAMAPSGPATATGGEAGAAAAGAGAAGAGTGAAAQASTASNRHSRSNSTSTKAWHAIQRVVDEVEQQRDMECSEPYTVVDYLTIKPPRSMQHSVLLRRLVPGHRVRGTPEDLLAMAAATRVDPDDVLGFDWWGSSVSHRGKELHMSMDRKELTAKDLDVTAGGRTGVRPLSSFGPSSRSVSGGSARSQAADG